MAAAQHLVADFALPVVHVADDGLAPSTTIRPSAVQALRVARAPHQHSAPARNTSVRSAGSDSRCGPPGGEAWA